MADIVSIGIALDTSQVLSGTRQVDQALKQVAASSTQTTQATQKVDQAAKTAGQALTTESKAAQDTASALKQTAQASTAASQAAQAAAKAAQSVADALKQTDRAAQGAGSQLGAVDSAMRRFASQTASFALAQAGVAGFQQALTTAKDTLVELVQTGIAMQNLRTSFAAVSGGATAGAKEFQFVTKTALSLGLSLQTVAEQYRSLSAATRGTSLQGADTRELFVALSKASQAYGLSTEQLGRAMTAFQQIISKGKVSMEELRGQLGEAIPGAMQIAARAYGTNTQALEGMIEKGVAAEGFVRRFTTQLIAEVPPAAERAGKGITNFGTEILLLKGKMAETGLIPWIDTIIGKLAELLRLGREGQEKIQRAAERRTTREIGGPEVMDALEAKDKKTLTEVTRQLTAAEKNLREIERSREAGGLLTTAQEERDARLLVKDLEQQVAAMRAKARLATAERQELASRGPLDERQRTRQYSFAGQAEQSAELTTFLKEAKAREDAAKKAEAALQTTTKVGLGRDPTLEEKVKLQEKLVKDNQEWLEANQKFADQAKDDPAVKALRERGKLQEAATKGLVDAKQATQDAEKAETERKAKLKAYNDEVAQLEEQIKKTQGSELEAFEMDMRHKGYQGAELAKLVGLQRQFLEARKEKEAGAEAEKNIEQLRRMAAQYGDVKLARDEDTASTLAASLATSQHNEKAQEYLKTIQDTIKVEEQLPKLRAEAAASADALTKTQRDRAQIEKEFTRTRRRGQTTEERLGEAYGKLAQQPGTMGDLAAKAAQMQEVLDTEMWEKWEEVGIAAFDHVSAALEDFVFKGKLSFKDMMGAIAQDLFHFATQQLMQSATKKGGWLETGLDLGLKLVGIAGGISGSMPGSGTLPTTMEAYNIQAAAGRFSGKQHGGPVTSGTPYMVGEHGPELFVPRMSGVVVPHGQAAPQATVVNVNVYGVQDAPGIIQSRGAISRAMLGALAQARQQM